MGDFRFQHELDPASRADAALNGEEQRLGSEIESARRKFWLQSRRSVRNIGIVAAVASAEWLARANGHLTLSIVLGLILLALAIKYPRGLGLMHLLRNGREVISTKRQLREWQDVQREVRSQLKEE